jgi:hypothetical protein
MRLCHFNYNNFQYKKKFKKSKHFNLLIIKFNFLSIIKLHIFSFFNWTFFHSFYNLTIFLKLQSFLGKLTSISNNFKNQNSRIHLIKSRIEHFFLNDYSYKNWYPFILKTRNKLLIPINQLQLIPSIKNVFANNKKCILSIFFNILILRKLTNYNLNFIKKKSLIILNLFCNFSNIFFKLKISKSYIFTSLKIENLNLLSESYCSLFGLLYLITCKRKFYSKLVLIKFIKICFLRINFFRNLAILQLNKKKLQVKIDPSFSSLLRSGNIKFFVFYKLANFDFKILPSKNHVPIYIFLEIYKMLGNNKKIFQKNQLKINKKKIFIKNKNVNVFQKTNKNVLNCQIYLPEIHWSLKKKILKKGVCFLFNVKWSLECILIKESKDFYSEIFGIIFISQIEKLFQENFLDLWLNSFFIYPTHLSSGMVSMISNSITLHEINKKKINNEYTKSQKNKKIGQYKFIESLAAYSLFCFIFQLKDRHNGNILINLDNRVIHVDFGYILGYFPGNLKFEADSFKLSTKFMLELNGKQTENFEYFRELFLRGFITLKKNYSKLIIILKSFSFRYDFKYNITYSIKNFVKRFDLNRNEKEIMKYCLKLIEDSIENWKTIQYDKYQLHASGIN